MKATEANIWLNDKSAVIKLVTSDPNTYDLQTIVKIYDGAAGTDTVSAVLSNENHLLPVDSKGTVKSWEGSETQIYIYEGGKDVTSSWSIRVSDKADTTSSSKLTGTYDSTTHIYKPSKLEANVGYAEFICTRSGYAQIVKRFTVTKQYAGADGEAAVIYDVSPDVYAMNISEAGVFTPARVTFTAYRKSGADLVKSNYSGRFIITESNDGTNFGTASYTSSSDEYTKAYTPSNKNVKAIRCVLYEAGGTTVQLDSQTIVVTRDGNKGQDGHNGQNGITIHVGNDSETIPCTTDGKAASAKDISIPFYGYDGITLAEITCAVGTRPGNVSIKSNTPGSSTGGGLLVLHVDQGETFGNANLLSGDITLTFTCKGTSVEKKFTWTKNKQAANGQNAVLFQLFSPDGGTIYNSTGSTTIETSMVSGSTAVTPTKFEWSKYEDGTYKVLTDKTSKSLVVTADMVDSTSWFRCVATYAGTNYTAYWTVEDRSDPVMAYTFSTVAEFKNSKGEGAVYTRVYRNGEELDPIKTLVFSTTAPTSPAKNDFYYHLDKTAKTCTLKKYDGSAWKDATEKDTLTYEYYRVDGTGKELDTTTAYTTQRCFYIDPSIIKGSMQFRCKVSD